MINQSKYLPKQMNGPVLNSVMTAVEEELSDAKVIMDYLYHLTIRNAQETELESIGCIVGFPRPLVPVGFNEDNLLILGTIPVETDLINGLSTVGSEVGGRFSTIKQSKSNYMDLGLYRNLLDKVAYIKRYGITLYSVDQIARLVSDDYTIDWNENYDITINFNQSIGYKNVWVLTNLFMRLSTEPQVIITSGGDE